VSATYVCLDDLANMIRAGERFVVRDAETGADLTREVLDRLH
jgi:polyhydroxyalkanoate synthesis regulator protein